MTKLLILSYCWKDKEKIGDSTHGWIMLRKDFMGQKEMGSAGDRKVKK